MLEARSSPNSNINTAARCVLVMASNSALSASDIGGGSTLGLGASGAFSSLGAALGFASFLSSFFSAIFDLCYRYFYYLFNFLSEDFLATALINDAITYPSTYF